MKKSAALMHFGSATRVADALGISQAAVSQWPEEIPELRAYQIERITGGALKVDDSSSQNKKPNSFFK